MGCEAFRARGIDCQTSTSAQVLTGCGSYSGATRLRTIPVRQQTKYPSSSLFGWICDGPLSRSGTQLPAFGSVPTDPSGIGCPPANVHGRVAIGRRPGLAIGQKGKRGRAGKYAAIARFGQTGSDSMVLQLAVRCGSSREEVSSHAMACA